MAWDEDVLGRSPLGKDVATYLISRDASRRAAGINDGFVFAIDAPYGEGKTFFLRNLGAQLELEHPVAYIDAWSDDAAGQPLMALLDALDSALSKYFRKDQSIAKAGRLAKNSISIIGAAIKGAGKKAASRYLGDEFGDEIESVWTGGKGVSGDKSSEFVEKAADESIEETEIKIRSLLESRSDKRLQEFRVAKKEIKFLKDNLKSLVRALDRSDVVRPPIFVLVDELDRCRPDYSIEFIEEIKHLFDVPGIVFVLAITGNQLVSSAGHVYGPAFDSGSYFHRLIHNRYMLPRPSTSQFIAQALRREPLDETAFGSAGIDLSIADALGYFADIQGMSLREAERLVDRARVASSLMSGTMKLQPALLASRLADVEVYSSLYDSQTPTRRIERKSSWDNQINCIYSSYEGKYQFELPLKQLISEHHVVFNYDTLIQPRRIIDLSDHSLVRDIMVNYHFSVPHRDNGITIGSFYDSLCARLAPFVE